MNTEERITQLETRLASAEKRIADLEARLFFTGQPVIIWQPYVIPTSPQPPLPWEIHHKAGGAT